MQKQTSKNDVAVVGTGQAAVRCLGRSRRDPLSPDARKQRSPAISTRAQPGRGQWQHLAATFDGTTARFYVDGVRGGDPGVSGSVGSSNTWRIGAYGSSPGGFFDGLIDDVRIYNRALTPGEITTDMNQPVDAGSATGHDTT